MTTVYTPRLAGSTLDELLDAAERDQWPNDQCPTEWELLRNWALQTESFMLDEAENLAWEQTMRALGLGDLAYTDWVQRRTDALAARVRARKLAQTRLRYAYGFKQPRRWRLVARQVRRLYLEWSEDAVDPGASDIVGS